jgi:hypothetical protein
VLSTTPTNPGHTVSALKYEIGHLMVTRLAAHIALMAPYPLCDLMMSTSNIFVLGKYLHYLIEDILPNCRLCIGFNRVIDSLIGHDEEPTLVPEWTATIFPDGAAFVAELFTASKTFIRMYTCCEKI